MNTIVSSPRAPASQESLYPLTEFYARYGRALPTVTAVEGSDVPEPYQSLLVHRRDMTPTLEDFYGCDIHLEILHREQVGDLYFRQVVLRLNDSDRAVEFGANKIRLDFYPPEIRDLILAEHLPLGHILKVFGLPHTSLPQAFLRVESDAFINQSLGLVAREELYGRRNTLRDPLGRPLSEIVEILAPPGTRAE